MFKPTDAVACCPGCGAARTVEVDEGRNDYYLGDLYRCSACGIGFHFTEADPAPIRSSGAPTGFALLLYEGARRALDVGPDVFLAEMERGAIGEFAEGATVRVPLLVSPSDAPGTTEP